LFSLLLAVMAGLVPAIHVLPGARKAWMRGTSPRMTVQIIAAWPLRQADDPLQFFFNERLETEGENAWLKCR
jgi:hypothetical protein